MTLEILIVALLILVNGFFALSEMAVVTARKAKLRQLAGDSRRAQAALELAEHPERFLSTVQVGITLIGILNGVFFVGTDVHIGCRAQAAGVFDQLGFGLGVVQVEKRVARLQVARLRSALFLVGRIGHDFRQTGREVNGQFKVCYEACGAWVEVPCCNWAPLWPGPTKRWYQPLGCDQIVQPA